MNINKTKDANQNESFSYDALGNRLTYNGIASTYDNSGQRIQDDGQFTYVFDANGNIIYKQNKSNGISYTFEYSALNQLKKATVTSTPLNGNVLKSVEYKYDPVGRRISRQVTDFEDSSKSKTQKFYYDGDNIIAELDESNNLAASYTHSPLRPDDILGAKFTSSAVSNNLAASAGYVYYLKDHLNTVNEITNAVGDIVQKMEHSAFGGLRSVKNPTGTEMGFANTPVRSSFTYTGREYEPELGMYYYRARYYDPSVGRFLQQDPDPGKLNNPNTFLSKYTYTGNSPINFTDSTGRDFFRDLGKLFKGLFGHVSDWIGHIGAEFDKFIKNSETIKVLILIAAAAAAFVLGPLIAGWYGLTGGWAALGSALAGAAVGGTVAGLGYSTTGLGTFADGFRIGAAIGAIAGGLRFHEFGSPKPFIEYLANPTTISEKAIAIGAKSIAIISPSIFIPKMWNCDKAQIEISPATLFTGKCEQ